MEFEFRTGSGAGAAAAVLKNQLEQLVNKKITAHADGSRITIAFPSLSGQKKKVADYTAKRLAELMRSLQDL